MADDLERQALPGFADRASERRALRRALAVARPDIRIAAEGFLADYSPIDLLGVGAAGELISIRLTARGDDLETLTRALADLSWLSARRAQLLKLAAGLGIDPASEPRALLVAPGFGPETRAAIEQFPVDTVQLWQCRSVPENGEAVLRIEPVLPTDPAPDAAHSGATPNRLAPPNNRPLTAPPSPSAFRTGLSEADLRPAERPETRRDLAPDPTPISSPGR